MKKRKISELYFKPVFKSGYCEQCADHTLGVRPPVPLYVYFIGFFGPIVLAIVLAAYAPELFSELLNYGSIIHMLWLAFLIILMFSPQMGLLRKLRCTKCRSTPPIWTTVSSENIKPITSTSNSNKENWSDNIKEIVPLDTIGKKNKALNKRIRYKAILSFFCLDLLYLFILLFTFIPWWVLPFFSFNFGLLIYYYICRYYGWKNDILYLRRFRTASDVDWVTSTFENGLYKKYRSVTLDGSDLKSISNKTTNQYPVPISILIAIPFAIPIFILNDIQFISELFAFLPNIEYLFLRIFLGIFIWFPVLLIALLYYRKRNSITLIDNPRKLTIFSKKQQNIRKWQYSSKLSTPPLVVIKTADSMWQNAVLELAAICDFVILDVSTPSSALLWEIEKSKNLFDKKTIFVAHKEKFQNWVHLASDEANDFSKNESNSADVILEYIREKSILLYNQPSQFAKSLRNVLDNQPRDEYSQPLKYNEIDFLKAFYGIKTKSKKRNTNT